MLVGRKKEWNKYKDEGSYLERIKVFIRGNMCKLDEVVRLENEVVGFSIVSKNV
jgi:hypothetical protein